MFQYNLHHCKCTMMWKYSTLHICYNLLGFKLVVFLHWQGRSAGGGGALYKLRSKAQCAADCRRRNADPQTSPHCKLCWLLLLLRLLLLPHQHHFHLQIWWSRCKLAILSSNTRTQYFRRALSLSWSQVHQNQIINANTENKMRMASGVWWGWGGVTNLCGGVFPRLSPSFEKKNSNLLRFHDDGVTYFKV